MKTPIYQSAIKILEELVSFDTTSRRSNLALIKWVEEYLASHDIASYRVHNDDGDKANLYASIGPMVDGGIILSGHSDVVPVDGQAWNSDPWALTQIDDTLYGRGTCDMKGFLALALAGVPYFKDGKRPIHIAISYDEEVGCLGAPSMIAEMAEKLPNPILAIIGEPSMMKAISGHKGISVHEVEIWGHEAHSSLTHLGLSANMIAVELMHMLAELARELYENAPVNSPFDPAHSTLTIGKIEGGTAANILARHCKFVFDLRCAPDQNAEEILIPFKQQISELNEQIHGAFPDCGVTIKQLSNAPPLKPQEDDAAGDYIRSLTGDNSISGAVAYAAEAGQFQQAGFLSVICGPGSIEQAHQPNEYVTIEQMQKGAEFMERLAQSISE